LLSLLRREHAALSALLVSVLAGLSPPRLLAAEIAVLKSGEVPAWRPALDALQRSAATHTLTEYDLKNDRARGEEIVRSLKGRAAVLVGVGALAAQLAHELLPEVPLVFCMLQDPVQSGIVPGPGLTGVAFNIPVRNQLAAFRIAYPGANRIGVLYNPATTGKLVEEAEKAAAVVRATLVTKPISTEKDVPGALRALLAKADTVDAIWLIPEPLLLSDESRHHILSETLDAHKPIFSFSNTLVAEGALISSGPDYASIGEKTAELVNRMVAGERKIDLLVPKAEIVINTKVAAKLKIMIPPEILKSARVY
jgi:putative ABC transport system substrate-binding protein